MTYSVELIVNTGQFEHAKLTISASSAPELMLNLADLNDEVALFVGKTSAGLNGAIKHGYRNSEPVIDPIELITSELGATVIETVELTKVDSEDAPTPPWKRSVTPVQDKPWQELGESVKAPSTGAVADLGDF